MNTTLLGVDPGSTGALAVIPAAGDIVIYDTPTYIVVKNKKKRAVYDMVALVNILRELKDKHPEMQVVLEEVHAMPKTGSQGNFGSGMGYGMWLALFAALQIPFATVQPSIWKKVLGLKAVPGSSDTEKKNMDRLFAQQLFPKAAAQLARVKDHGRADALLIAEFGRRSASMALADAA